MNNTLNTQTKAQDTTMLIPNFIVIEADNLSKETGLPFRDLVEVLFTAFLEKEDKETVEELSRQLARTS